MSGALKRDEWETVRLGDVCDIYTGTGFPVQYQGEKTGVFPFYKVGDISRNVSGGNVFLGNCDNFISEDVAKILKGTIIPKDTVVFAKIGEAVKLNRRAVTVQDCLVDNNAMGVCPNQARVFLSYFYHYMCHLRLETYAESTTVPSVKKSVIEKIKIPLPPLDIQRQIADTLDKVTELIDLRKKQLKKLDELVKARFVELLQPYFDKGETQPLIKLVREDRPITYGILKPGTNYEGGYPVIRVKDFSRGLVSVEEVLHTTPEIYNKYLRSVLAENDIIISIGGTIGRIAVIPKEFSGANITQHTARIALKDNRYLLYFRGLLESDMMQRWMKERVLGVAQPSINLGDIKQMPIPIVDECVIKQLNTFVEQTDKSKSIVQQSLGTLETLKKSLMQEYFGLVLESAGTPGGAVSGA